MIAFVCNVLGLCLFRICLIVLVCFDLGFVWLVVLMGVASDLVRFLFVFNLVCFVVGLACKFGLLVVGLRCFWFVGLRGLGFGWILGCWLLTLLVW